MRLNKGFKNCFTRMSVLMLAFAMLVTVIPLNLSASAQSSEKPSVTVTAEKSSDEGIARDTTFLVSGSSLTKDILKKQIVFYPKREFDVEEFANHNFRVTPKIPFESKSLVTITLQDEEGKTVRRWAFQTETVFEILSTLPKNMGDYVPLDTGIEVQFSEKEIDIKSFEKAFHISPKVSGTYQQFGDTVTFIPKNGLDYETVYNITIDGTVSNLKGEKISEGRKFSFKTESENTEIYADRIFYNYSYGRSYFLPSETPVMSISLNDDYRDKTIKTMVYRFRSSSDYLAELQKYNKNYWNYDYKPDMNRLSQVKSFEQKAYVSDDDYWSGEYIVFPNALKSGCYLAVASMTDNTGNVQSVSKFIQVSNLSVYSASNGSDGLVWVNDASTGEPVSNANISFIGSHGTDTGITANDGTAVVKWDKCKDTPDDDYYYYYTPSKILNICKNKDSFVDLVSIGSNYELEKYFTYVYTDRELYLPKDKIHMWGLIKPRQKDAVKPEKLTACLMSNSGAVMQEVPVTLSATGIFKCDLAFSDLQSGGYRLYLENGDEVLISKYISIHNYDKSNYILTANTKTDFYVEPDDMPIHVDVSCNFYDGSPVSNLPISINANEGKYPKDLKLDSNGSAGFDIKSDSLKVSESWEPHSVNYYVYAKGVEEKEYEARGYVTVAPRDTMLKAKVKMENGKPTISIATNKLDFSKIHSASELYDGYPENVKSKPSDLTGVCIVTRKYTVITGEETHYDFINKRTFKTYDYKSKEEIKEYPFKTANGVCTITDIPALGENDGYYSYEFCYKDGKSRPTCSDNYQIEWDHPYYNYQDEEDTTRSFSFQNQEKTTENTGYYYSYYQNFKINDSKPLSLKVSENNKRVKTETNSRFLTAKVQDSTFDVSVTVKDDVEINYDKKMFPNFSLIGAYFDGKHIYAVSEANVSYDPSDKELSIKVTPDKKQYRPSEQVNADILVTDASGKPVPDTDIVLSVVDEAQLDLDDQYINPLGDLYNDIYYPYIQIYTSYDQELDAGEGSGEALCDTAPNEGGAGGGSDNIVRSNFVDTTAFVTLKTDQNGKAKASFKIADNLTKWRITTIAISPNLEAGNSTTNITTQLPMFVLPVIHDTFLTGDTVNFSARTYGTQVDGTKDVTYTATVTGAKIKPRTVAAKKSAMSNTFFSFGVLPAGDYSITISGAYGKLKDAVRKPFSIVDSGLEARLTKNIKFEDIKKIKALRYPVLLGFYNASGYTFYDGLLSQLLYVYGQRADQRIVSVLADQKLSELSDGQYDNYYTKLTPFDLTDSDGLVPLLPYSEGNVILTAKIVATAPQFINQDSVAEALQKVVDKGGASPELAAAYMGLAALHKPVLLDIQKLLENPSDFKATEQMRLISALALAGDFDGASANYEKLVVPKLKTEEFFPGCTYTYYNAGEKEENIAVTAAASITATILNHKTAQGLVTYLAKKKSKYDLTILEQMFYIENTRPEPKVPASLSYNLSGKKYSIDLGKRGVRFVAFSKEQLNAAIFQKISGNVGVTAVYIGNAADLQGTANKSVKITKTVAATDEPGLYMVTLHADTPVSGSILIQDYIPTGARFVSLRYDNDYHNHLTYNEKKNIRIYCYESYDTTSFNVYYYIKTVTPGEYVLEAPLATMQNCPAWGQGVRQKLKMKL